MRILLLADIHGNWPALQAVQEPHDLCLCLGDLVDYALERMREDLGDSLMKCEGKGRREPGQVEE